MTCGGCGGCWGWRGRGGFGIALLFETSGCRCPTRIGRDLPAARRQSFRRSKRQIEADRASGKMPTRKVLAADYITRRALWLPENARYEWIMRKVSHGESDSAKLVTEAMVATGAGFEPPEVGFATLRTSDVWPCPHIEGQDREALGNALLINRRIAARADPPTRGALPARTAPGRTAAAPART